MNTGGRRPRPQTCSAISTDEQQQQQLQGSADTLSMFLGWLVSNGEGGLPLAAV